tara:strand:+ start:431 stop:1180 length:750 start_codon:yes stop_codon:yes gene_type:complete
MFGGHFYHERIRKSVAVFGRLFNNLYVVRKDAAGGVLNQMKVPLSYAPKNKFLDRIRENPSLQDDTRVAIKLPRMSFEITDISYDLTRQLTKVSNFNTVGNTRETRNKFFSPVPYNIGFSLNIFAKSQEDALQLVEQILPTFNPQYTISIFPFKDIYPTFVEDVPIVITSVSFSDDFEGQLETRRTIIYTLTFEMKVQFYGNIENKNIIRKSQANVFESKAGSHGRRQTVLGKSSSKRLLHQLAEDQLG